MDGWMDGWIDGWKEGREEGNIANQQGYNRSSTLFFEGMKDK